MHGGLRPGSARGPLQPVGVPVSLEGCRIEIPCVVPRGRTRAPVRWPRPCSCRRTIVVCGRLLPVQCAVFSSRSALPCRRTAASRRFQPRLAGLTLPRRYGDRVRARVMVSRNGGLARNFARFVCRWRAGAGKMNAAAACDRVFAATGPLSGLLPGYSPRAEQRAMAAAVERAVSQRDVLICEAGTGTGKTLAYLVPARRRRRPDRGLHRHPPSSGEAVRARSAARLPAPSDATRASRCSRAARTTSASGATSRCWPPAGSSRPTWPRGPPASRDGPPGRRAATSRRWTTSRRTIRSGARSPRRRTTASGRSVHVRRMPRRGGAPACHREADVVVVNHHLLFADMALKEQGFAELLRSPTPGHRRSASDPRRHHPVFGVELTERAASGTRARRRRGDAGGCAGYAGPRSAGGRPRGRGPRGGRCLTPAAQRVEWAAMPCEARERIDAMEARLGALAEALDAVSVRGPSIEAVSARARELVHRLGRIGKRAARARLRAMGGTTHTRVRRAPRAARHRPDPGRARRRGDRAWILTSATLSVAGSLDHFAARVGMADASLHIFDGSFDYRRQTRCYLPSGLPEPSRPGYHEAVAEVSVSVLTASRGRAFLLFTSHRALLAVREALDGRVPWPRSRRGSVRVASCSIVSSRRRIRSCWGPTASGKAWTSGETRSRWCSSTSCPSPLRTIP